MSGQRREYGQACGLAFALDIVGERWTLLIIRELLIRPARFNDLLDHLESIGPNLLSTRLRDLTKAGIVTSRQVPGDGRGREYALTPRGEELRPAILHLARWGLGVPHSSSTETRPEWVALAIEALVFDKSLPEDINEVYEFNVAGQPFYMEIESGRPKVLMDPPAKATSLQLSASTSAFLRIGSGQLSPLTAMANGQIKVDGDTGAFMRCGSLMGLLPSAIAGKR